MVPITLSDGTYLPKDTHFVVPSAAKLMDPSVVRDPDVFDGFRSYRRRVSGGLIGHLDFDRLQHRIVRGSMMASPSSTAAYLIHTSTWDDDAEAYLRRVTTRNGEYSRGGAPSACPSTHFELIWVSN